MATMVESMAVEGIDGFAVEVEATTLKGEQQMISIIGLGDQAVKEAGERYGYSARLLQLLKEGAEQAMEQAKRIQERCLELGIRILTYDDPHYAANIREYMDFPLVFFAKGTLRDNWTHGIGIVGARRCTQQGKEYAIHLAEDMVNQGYPIISGMAKGIDSYAHTAAINSGGYTVAVLGHGLDMCYPPEHETLMERIVDQGLILSEYPPGVRLSKYTFPQRNRIIAGLSDVVYVVDAGGKSGTKSTIEAAERYGKRVMSGISLVV